MKFFRPGTIAERNRAAKLPLPLELIGIINSFENPKKDKIKELMLLSDKDFYSFFASTKDPYANQFRKNNPELQKRYAELWEESRLKPF